MKPVEGDPLLNAYRDTMERCTGAADRVFACLRAWATGGQKFEDLEDVYRHLLDLMAAEKEAEAIRRKVGRGR